MKNRYKYDYHTKHKKKCKHNDTRKKCYTAAMLILLAMIIIESMGIVKNFKHICKLKKMMHFAKITLKDD
ncbi:hypothetical protein [Vallitalea okinawensis]|uniref:hypothetical protein n=1 Tax=Vallitalea okinawensis TaxID=2078660 RepID=UPI000CFCA1C9|nr:hypothetical protein [Vallitalea okinawensis]